MVVSGLYITESKAPETESLSSGRGLVYVHMLTLNVLCGVFGRNVV